MGAEDAAAAVAAMTAPLARSAAVAAMTPDDERWPAPPEAEAFKLGLFALVRLRNYEQLAAAALDGGRPVIDLVAGRLCAAAQSAIRARPRPLRQLIGVKGRYTPAFAARGLGAHQGSGGSGRPAAAARSHHAAARGRGVGDHGDP